MSINTNRAQARIKVTEDIVAKLENQIRGGNAYIDTQFAALNPHKEQQFAMTRKIRALEDALFCAKERLHLDEYPGDVDGTDAKNCDVAQVAAAEESLTRLRHEAATMLAVYHKELQFVTVMIAPLKAEILEAQENLVLYMNTLQKQKDALDIKEHIYPQQLGRHLRKCKKYGWADNRLSGKTK